MRNQAKAGLLCCVDLLPMEPVEYAHIITGDFTAMSTQQEIRKICENRNADVILSDMMHNTTGNRMTDQLNQLKSFMMYIPFVHYF